MKKIIYVVTIVLLTITAKLVAQPEGRQFDGLAMKEKQKAKLVEALNLTVAQADSVVTIQADFLPKYRGLRGLQPEERMAKMKELNDAMKAKYIAVLKDEKLVAKVLEFQEKQRQERMERVRAGE